MRGRLSASGPPSKDESFRCAGDRTKRTPGSSPDVRLRGDVACTPRTIHQQAVGGPTRMKVDNTSGRRNPGRYIVSIGANGERAWQPVRDRGRPRKEGRTEAPIQPRSRASKDVDWWDEETVEFLRRTEPGRYEVTVAADGHETWESPLAHGRPEGGDYDEYVLAEVQYLIDRVNAKKRGAGSKSLSERQAVAWLIKNRRIPGGGERRYFMSPTSRQAGAIGERGPPVGGQPREVAI